MRKDRPRYIVLKIGRREFVSLAALIIVCTAALHLRSEKINFTTSYPSPAGIYRTLTTTRATTLGRDQDNVIMVPNSNPAGNVGIGTTSPGAKLDVAGTIRIAGGGPVAGEVLTAVDGTGLADWQVPNAVPPGLVAFFNTSCPLGWSSYGAAAGRYVVGVPGAGTVGGVQGTALTNLENRAVGQHTHAVADPGHTHVYLDVHRLYEFWCVGAFGASCHGGHWIQNTWRTSNAAGTGIGIAAAGAVAGTNAPYIQLTPCIKN